MRESTQAVKRESDDVGNGSAAHPRTRPGVQERCFDFPLRVLRWVSFLPRGIGGETIGRRVCRCATAVGANVEEAQGAHTKQALA
ncbi:MAG: hypothetical protein HRF50_18380 [Phycisphaerae bacterium]